MILKVTRVSSLVTLARSASGNGDVVGQRAGRIRRRRPEHRGMGRDNANAPVRPSARFKDC
jgi:hypothetical protein